MEGREGEVCVPAMCALALLDRRENSRVDIADVVIVHRRQTGASSLAAYIEPVGCR